MNRDTRKNSFLSIPLTKSNVATCLSALICICGVFFAFGQWFARSYDLKIHIDDKNKSSSKSEFLLNDGKISSYSGRRPKKTKKIKKNFYKTLREERTDQTDSPLKLGIPENQKIRSEISGIQKNVRTDSVKSLQVNRLQNINKISNSNFSLQIASFRNLSTANDFLKKLKYKGFSAYIKTADLVGKGKWYRVRVDFSRENDGLKILKRRLKKDMKISKFQVIKN